ncbi:hypothetical protein FRX31_026949 [Thalictrum thalictroides]|uniref:Uncharacterized protein n=1 Tax=Thalictrum thalictroides TaxID=46969 RepID=A0A7J6VF10_THATH|nr:hypothetical protein FRX31_026949 [Thalictrum thalictroides]
MSKIFRARSPMTVFFVYKGEITLPPPPLGIWKYLPSSTLAEFREATTITFSLASLAIIWKKFRENDPSRTSIEMVEEKDDSKGNGIS